jgi:hypothetical protein
VWAVTTEFRVDLFKSTNQVENFFAIDRPTCGLAKVGPTTKGSGLVDETLLGLELEKGTGAVCRLR